MKNFRDTQISDRLSQYKACKNVQKLRNFMLIKLHVLNVRLKILVLTMSCENISLPIVVYEFTTNIFSKIFLPFVTIWL